MSAVFWAHLVGIPFGEGPGELTCWQLVRRVYAEVRGIDLPAYGEISAADLVRVARAMRAGADGETWHAVQDPEALDVVLMRGPSGGPVCHVGVMVDRGRFLHVEAASHSAIVPLGHPVIRNRIAGFRRYMAPEAVS